MLIFTYYKICALSHVNVFYMIHSGTHGLFKEFGRNANGNGSQECCILLSLTESMKFVYMIRKSLSFYKYIIYVLMQMLTMILFTL